MKIIHYIKKHWRERIGRYWLSELLSSSLGITGYRYWRHYLQENAWLWVFLWMALGNIWYLIPLIIKNLNKKSKHLPEHLTRRERMLSLFAEIWPASLIDNLITRPVIMRYGPEFLLPYIWDFWSVVICKLFTDVIFYIIAVADYEIIKLWKTEYEQEDYIKQHKKHEKE